MQQKQSLILGIDIGGTKSTVLIGTSSGEVLRRYTFATEVGRGFDYSFGQLVRNAQMLLDEWANVDSRQPEAVGVSVGGPLDLKAGRLLNPPHLPGWENLAIRDELMRLLKLPVYVEHDGNAGVLAEWLFGVGQGVESLIYLTAGTGFGAGLILDGRLYRGASSMAGEIGHVRVSEDGPEMFGKRGVFESFCGGTGIIKLANQKFPGLAQKYGPDYDLKRLAAAARNGETEALALFQESGQWLGRALALLADLLNPQMVIIGSLGLRLGELWLKPAMDEFEREALPVTFATCKVVTASLGENLQDVAALCAAIYGVLENPELSIRSSGSN
jgi:glucokinase